MGCDVLQGSWFTSKTKYRPNLKITSLRFKPIMGVVRKVLTTKAQLLENTNTPHYIRHNLTQPNHSIQSYVLSTLTCGGLSGPLLARFWMLRTCLSQVSTNTGPRSAARYRNQFSFTYIYGSIAQLIKCSARVLKVPGLNPNLGEFFSLKFLSMRDWTKWRRTTTWTRTTQVIPWSLANGRRQKQSDYLKSHCCPDLTMDVGTPPGYLKAGWFLM